MARTLKTPTTAKKKAGASSLAGNIKWRFRRAIKYPTALFAESPPKSAIIRHVG